MMNRDDSALFNRETERHAMGGMYKLQCIIRYKSRIILGIPIFF